MTKPSAVAGVVMVLTVVVAEVAARSAPYERLPSTGPIAQVAQKAAWLAAQPKPDFLIVGDSTAQRDVDLASFAAAAHGTVLDAAYSSGTAIVERRTTAGVSWVPATVVLGTTPGLLTDAALPFSHEVVAATVTERVGLMGPAAGVFSSMFSLYRNRSELLKSYLWLHPQDPTIHTFPVWGFDRFFNEDARGALAIEGAAFSSFSPEKQLAQTKLRWLDYAPSSGRVRVRALRDYLQSYRDRGAEVVLVLMPLTKVSRTYTDEYLGSMGVDPLALLREAGVPGVVLDCRAAVDDGGFYDPEHLRVSPERDAFSRALGAIVAAHGTECPPL